MAVEDPHIMSAFDRDLEALQAHLLRLGSLVETALMSSVRALETHDLVAADRVVYGDAAVDELEELIQTEAASLIARRAPTASDLRLVLATMRAATSLERVGDHAKNVAKRTRIIDRSAPVEGHAGSIRRMAGMAVKMLEDAQLALVRKDADLAMAVRNRDVDLDQMYNTLFRSLFTYMMESAANISPSMHLHFVAKNVERAGDHATSIAEQAYYLATGTMPAEPRQKGEAAALPSLG